MKHSASTADYLEAIMLLRESKHKVRVTELSKTLGVTKPSVSAALKKLTDGGLVVHQKYGLAELTAEGEKVAEDTYQRHEVLRRFLADILNVEAVTADEDACHLEHFLSPATREQLVKFVEFVMSRPEGHPKMLKMFHYYCEHGELPGNMREKRP